MSRIVFVVPGPVVPKGRPRRGKGGHFYTPPRTQAYEELSRTMALQARQKAGISRPFEGPCSVHIDLHLKTRGLTDIDNAAKALMDSINKVIYQDDRQVVELGVHIHVGSREPRAVVAIAELEAA